MNDLLSIRTEELSARLTGEICRIVSKQPVAEVKKADGAS